MHEEKRTGRTSCPELQAQLHAQAPQGQTCPGEKQQDLNFGLRDSSVGYSQDKKDMVTHLSVLSVQHCPTSPVCHSARCLGENTCLVPSNYGHPLMCQRLRSLLKRGRTNFLGKSLSLEIWRWLAKFQFLLSQLCSWESWCHHCLAKGSWGHLVPVPMWCLSLGHAGTEQQPQHFSTSMGREWAAAFQKFSFT